MTPTAPIYVVSKGRWQRNRRLTSRALHEMGVAHYVVVEEQETAEYRAACDSTASILVLDKSYQRNYDPCDDLGDTKSKGPGPARNFAWEHSIEEGFAWHWVMDDNIQRFYRLNRNTKIAVADGTFFAVMEAFVQRYENVAMAGPGYESVFKRRDPWPPFFRNTRIYSCNLIRNDVPYRWRGRYNEDTDLSLRMLKDGWATIQFIAFLQNKVATQVVEGGNTDEFYALEGTKAKSEMLVRLHPDVAKMLWRYNRWHHHVDYLPFKKNLLVRRGDIAVPAGIDEFGMVLERRDPASGEWVAA